jgi:hypothetical protein
VYAASQAIAPTETCQLNNSKGAKTMFNQPSIKDRSQPRCIWHEIVVELDEGTQELLVGGSSSSTGNITLTAGGSTTQAIALPSLLNQTNKAK